MYGCAFLCINNRVGLAYQTISVYTIEYMCCVTDQIFGLLVLSFDHWEILLELQGQQYLSWAQRSSLYNLGYLLSHSARLYQPPMICTRSNRPRSAPSRAQCTWKSLGSLKSGRCFRTNLTHFAVTTGSVGN